MNFKLRQLQGFALAAHFGSFSRAARELAMTQPAFSQLIRDLENILSVQLFERTTRRVELTDAGRRFLAMIERPLDDLGDAYKTVREQVQGRRGRVTFAALPSVAFGFATLALARFSARHPAITVKVVEEQNFIIVDKVLNREVDFGIGTLSGGHAELAFQELLLDELVAVFPAKHALAAARRVSWKNLTAHPLILLPRQTSVRHLADGGFTVSGVILEPNFEVGNMVTALSMVRAGLGVTILPLISLGELKMDGLRYCRISNPRPTRNIGIITRTDRVLSPAAASYLRFLFDEKHQKKGGSSPPL